MAIFNSYVSLPEGNFYIFLSDSTEVAARVGPSGLGSASCHPRASKWPHFRGRALVGRVPWYGDSGGSPAIKKHRMNTEILMIFNGAIYGQYNRWFMMIHDWWNLKIAMMFNSLYPLAVKHGYGRAHKVTNLRWLVLWVVIFHCHVWRPHAT